VYTTVFQQSDDGVVVDVHESRPAFVGHIESCPTILTIFRVLEISKLKFTDSISACLYLRKSGVLEKPQNTFTELYGQNRTLSKGFKFRKLSLGIL
jgi:hypothetical protein